MSQRVIIDDVFYFIKAPNKNKLMPYTHNQDLPENVQKHLPMHAQSIYREAFNHAWQQYQDQDRDRESIAHRVAWSAVKKKYILSSHGQWVTK